MQGHIVYTWYTPGNLDSLNKMLDREKVNESFRLREARAFEVKKVKGKHTNIDIIEILTIVTKNEECYSPPDRLRKIIIVKYLLKTYFLSRNRFSSWLVVLSPS